MSGCAHACAQAFYVVNQAPEEGHHYSLGLIDKEMVRPCTCSLPSNPWVAAPLGYCWSGPSILHNLSRTVMCLLLMRSPYAERCYLKWFHHDAQLS